jgi:hypothetical protein
MGKYRKRTGDKWPDRCWRSPLNFAEARLTLEILSM